MGDDEATAGERRAALAPYRLDDALLDRAAPGAIALHCLPAHPGEEITAEVLYGDRQRIWDQAENRRHAQKALLECSSERRVRATCRSHARRAARVERRPSLSRSPPARATQGSGAARAAHALLDPLEVVVLTRERVQEAVDDAVERGRMTRDDATALVAALFERGRRQTDDLIAQLEAVVSGTPTRLGARSTARGARPASARTSRSLLRRPDRGAGRRAA